MIEIRTQESVDSRMHRILLDGVELTREQAYVFGIGGRDLSVTIHRNGLHLLRRQRLSEFPSEVGRLMVDLDDHDRDVDLRLRPTFSRENTDKALRLGYAFAFRVPFWKRPWSMGELRDAVRAQVSNSTVAGVEWSRARTPMSMPNFTIDIQTIDPHATVAELLDEWTPKMHGLLAVVERLLATSVRNDSLVAMFDFPADVRVSCEQYLLYFVEFLKDVGVDAQADLTHDAGRALFSVTPKDGAQALDRIREALECYLELPAASDFGDMNALVADPRVQQLMANIQHLRGQLYLANASLQFKDATIAQFAAANATAPQALQPDVLKSSLRLLDSSKSKIDDEEEIVAGIVFVSTFHAKGVSVNLAELYRRFRQKFLSPPGDECPEADL